MQEVWKQIRGYEGIYDVSNTGIVRRLPCEIISKVGQKYRTKSTIKMKSRIMPNGYLSVSLRNGNIMKRASFYIHRLVAEAFCENPMCLTEVNHKDENKLNNNADNLEWCTHKYNTNYGTIKERMSKSKINNPKLSFKVGQYSLDGKLINKFPSEAEAARATGCLCGEISRCVRGCRGMKQHRGYMWRRIDG